MCFTENVSLTIGIAGILASYYFYNKNKLYASIGIGYFALMEILQFFQYKVVNQCDNKYNKFLAYLGYYHICFQPLFFNIWLFSFIHKPNFIILYMAFFAGLLLASRTLFVKDNELCETDKEALCGNKTCVFSGTRHIAWNVRLRNPGKWGFTPSIGLYFFMFCIPVLSTFQWKPILMTLLSGPYLGIFLTKNIHEKPAIWCYTSIMQMLLSYFFIK